MTTPDTSPNSDPVAGSATTPTEPATAKITIEPKPEEDPIQKLQSDPNALTQLLSQVQALTAKVTEVTTERDSYKTKEESARRAQQTKEEQLQTDLDKERQRTEQLFNILKQKVVENAISNAKGYEWYSIKQVMAELDEKALEIDIDTESLTGTVTGIDSELKRIAQLCPWMISKDKTKTPEDGQRRPQRPSGTPVAPPTGEAAKLSKREALIKKYPIIAQGRV
jgi:hypothetical protein